MWWIQVALAAPCTWEGPVDTLRLDVAAVSDVATLSLRGVTVKATLTDKLAVVATGPDAVFEGSVSEPLLRLVDPLDWPGIHADVGVAVTVARAASGLLATLALPRGYVPAAPVQTPLGWDGVALGTRAQTPRAKDEQRLVAGEHALRATPDGAVIGHFRCADVRDCDPVDRLAVDGPHAQIAARLRGVVVEGWVSHSDLVDAPPGLYSGMVTGSITQPVWVRCAAAPLTLVRESGEHVLVGRLKPGIELFASRDDQARRVMIKSAEGVFSVPPGACVPQP